jgi:hypothetical protein
MAVPKFYRVLRGQRGLAAKTKFLNHLEGLDTVSEIGTRGNRAESTELLIVPFNLKLGADVFLEQSALTPSWTALKAAIGTHAKDNPPASSTQIKIRGARAARISATSGLLATGTVKTSKLTGLRGCLRSRKALIGYSLSIDKPTGNESNETILPYRFKR